MNKRRILGLSLVGCLAIACLLPIVLILVRQDLCTDRERFNALWVGMTLKEVERALGGPARNETSGHAMVWARRPDGRLYSSRAGAAEVSFFPQVAEGQQVVVWVSKAGLIAVSFDVDGRLHDKYFSTVHDPGGPSGPLRWLAREAKFTPKL
jgi:hypothetical protein